MSAGSLPALIALLTLVAVLALAAPTASAQDVAPEPPAEAPVVVVPATEELAEPVIEVPGTGEPVPVEEPPADDALPAEPVQQPPPGAVEQAGNDSIVFQVIWQRQEGCRTHCHGTTQQQDAVQRSETTQDATAEGTDAAVARNRSKTVQFVWQQQLGCVAFCFETNQIQSATQWAQTDQTATALAEAITAALNISETFQLAWQSQESCRLECHGAVASQQLDQRAGTTQVSNGESSGSGGVLGWLESLAQNIGATIQTIFQDQQSDCLEHCFGGSLTQRALQEAAVEQSANADVAPTPPALPADPAPSANQAAAAATPPPPGDTAPEEAAPEKAAPVVRMAEPVAVAAPEDLKLRPARRRSRAPRTDLDAATGPSVQPPQSPPAAPASAPAAVERQPVAPASPSPARVFHRASADDSPAPSPISVTLIGALALLVAACVQISTQFWARVGLHTAGAAPRVGKAPGPRRNP
jgi:hypothetical protein